MDAVSDVLLHRVKHIRKSVWENLW